MPSNHLWFPSLTRKPTAFLGCVAQSFLRCRDLFVMFDCSSYCLQGLALSQRLRHNCCFAHRGIDTLCLTDIQSVGTLLSHPHSLSLFFLFLLDWSFCSVFLLKSKLLGKQDDLIVSVPHLVTLSSNCHLD